MIGLFLITLAGSLLRLIRLATPRGVVFDETYYAKDACLYLGHTQTFCKVGQATEQSYVHPPLGKWIIAIGIKAFGYNEFGWRIASAVFGSAMILLVYLLARKLFGERWIASVAAILVASDFLLIVQSRIAMLDIFEAFFVLLGLVFLAYDRERLMLLRQHALLPFPGEPPAREFEWRFATGAAFGLAVAVKWSAAWAIIGTLLLAMVWSWSYLRTSHRSLPDGESKNRAPFKKTLRKTFGELALTAIALGVIPIVVYLTSYSKYFADQSSNSCAYRGPSSGEYDRKPANRALAATDLGRIDFGVPNGQCAKGLGGVTYAFIDLQERMANYHLTLNATHTYKSKAWTWPFVKRPIAYYYQGSPKATHILAFGNPATWWASLLAAVWLLVRSFSYQRWRPERVVVTAWAAQYLPWLLVSRPLFFFYMTPVVPLMMIGLAATLASLRQTSRTGRVFVLLYLLVGVGALLYYFYPVIAAVGLRNDLWQSRMWFKSWI